MKKIIYSILAIGMSLTGCTDWDDAVSENYGVGPEISINVTATADNSFSFTLTPSNGSVFYSYVVDKGSEASELDGYSLLKQQYSGVDGGLLNATENATATIEVEASPNTSYVVYAVASNDKGIVGNVTSQLVKTTDSGIPAPASAKTIEDEVAVQVAFSEGILRGDGAVTAQYFVEWTGEFIDIAAEDITVNVSDNTATFKFTNVPASATVLVSWAEGAFVDNAGNKCQAFKSGLNSAGTAFSGVYFNVADVPFDITKENVTSPEVGGSFGDWTKTMFTFTFDMDVYRNSKLLEGNEIKVSYTHKGKVTTVDVPTDYWTVQGKNLIFLLPEEPAFGDWVSVSIAEGSIYDVYGNPNTETVLENVWLRSYGYTRDMVIGNYTLTYTSYWGGDYTEQITISADPESEDGLIIDGFLSQAGIVPNSVKAIFDGDYGTITIADEQLLYETPTAYYLLVDAEGVGTITVNVLGNGNLTISQMWGYYVLAKGEGNSGYYDASISATFVKNVAAMRSTWRDDNFRTLDSLFIVPKSLK